VETNHIMKKFLFFMLLPIIGSAQVQIGTNINGEAAGDNSSNAISLSADGSVVAIGAYLNDGNGTDSGQVRVYKNIAGTWTQIGADINGSAAGDYSGTSISLSADGNTLAIGSPRNYSFSGQVRIYKNISGVWTQHGTTIQGATFGDNSGWSVSLSSDGNTVAIGAIGKYTEGIMTGGVKVYKNISGLWTQEGNEINGFINSNSFGRCVDLSADGNILAIAEPYTTVNGGYSGRVRVYQNLSGVWTQQGGSIDGTYSNGIFGASISLSSDGSTIAIGAPGSATTATDAGLVKVYKNISGTWTQLGTTLNGTMAIAVFGSSVALSGDGQVLCVGANHNLSVNVNPGQAQVFKYESGNWVQKGSDIIGSDNENLGHTVALSGDGHTLAIGAIFNNANGTNAGQARLFDISSLLATDHFAMEGLSVSPNPATDILSIHVPEGSELESLTLYNALGQVVRKGKETTIAVGDLAKGAYFVEVKTNMGKTAKSIIIQ
jgi:Flp pilus assembly pilin Flp